MAKLSNGKLLDGNYHSGAEIQQKMGIGRRAVEISGKSVKNVNPAKNYSPEEISRIREIPDRCKGGYFKDRSPLSKSIIYNQIVHISKNLFKDNAEIEFDDENMDWLVIDGYKMPKAWGVDRTQLMIIFPTEYPELPPVGFYLPDTLQSPNGHFYSGAYHNASEAPIEKGWNWYCAYIKAGNWRPSWRPGDGGDTLWEYITLVGELISGKREED